MFAQTIYDLFSIKENRNNCLEVPQSWKGEHKYTEKLPSQFSHRKHFVLSTDEKKKKYSWWLLHKPASECFI